MDVNMLGKFFDMTLLIRLLFGVEIFRVVGDGKKWTGYRTESAKKCKIHSGTAAGVLKTNSEDHRQRNV